MIVVTWQAWTYHPMLNISVIPQRKYNLAPGVINKLYNTKDAKVASVTSMADTSRIALTILTILVILSRQVLSIGTDWLTNIPPSQLVMTNLKSGREDGAVHRYKHSQHIS